MATPLHINFVRNISNGSSFLKLLTVLTNFRYFLILSFTIIYLQYDIRI